MVRYSSARGFWQLWSPAVASALRCGLSEAQLQLLEQQLGHALPEEGSRGRRRAPWRHVGRHLLGFRGRFKGPRKGLKINFLLRKSIVLWWSTRWNGPRNRKNPGFWAQLMVRQLGVINQVLRRDNQQTSAIFYEKKTAPKKIVMKCDEWCFIEVDWWLSCWSLNATTLWFIW